MQLHRGIFGNAESANMLCMKFPFLPQEQLPSHLPSLAREMAPSGWTMWSVLEMKPNLLIVPTMQLAVITVATHKMLVSDVKVSSLSVVHCE